MKTSCGKFLDLAHYFPYDLRLRLLAHSRSFLANQKDRNAIVGAENLLNMTIKEPEPNYERLLRPLDQPDLNPLVYSSTPGQCLFKNKNPLGHIFFTSFLQKQF